jgi:hypothetical protein
LRRWPATSGASRGTSAASGRPTPPATSRTGTRPTTHSRCSHISAWNARSSSGCRRAASCRCAPHCDRPIACAGTRRWSFVDRYVLEGHLTDDLLTWQTEALLAREDRRTSGTVWVRPELVVEIALDGVQISRRYPGGVALRFARVRGYRPDKDPVDADTIDTVRNLL